MMLRDSFGLGLEADWVEQSLNRVLAAGIRTPDISQPGKNTVGTAGFLEHLNVEMQRTFEHAEKYGWGV
jgi:3-isopropylmalate dehydrogenase